MKIIYAAAFLFATLARADVTTVSILPSATDPAIKTFDNAPVIFRYHYEPVAVFERIRNVSSAHGKHALKIKCLQCGNAVLDALADQLGNPFDYLKDLFTRLAAAKITQIKEFTPAAWAKSRVKVVAQAA